MAMNRPLMCLAVIVQIMAIAAVSHAKIVVTGTIQSERGSVALIDGKVYEVNDRIAGGRITAIDERGMTVLKGGKATRYTVKAKASPKVSSLEKPDPDENKNWLSRFVNSLKGMTEGLGKAAPGTAGLQSEEDGPVVLPENAGELPLCGKMQWADRVLTDMERYCKNLAAGPVQACKTGRELTELQYDCYQTWQEKVAQFNALHLPCPSTSDNAAYLRWARAFEQRKTGIFFDLNTAYRAKADALGFRPHPVGAAK